MASAAQAPPAAPAPAVGGVQTVRRVITYLLLLVMVIIAAMGLSGLLERALGPDRSIVSYDNYGLAQNLAFSLIAGPLAALLWWLVWRTSASARDRASVAWPVYLVITSTIALITFTTSLFGWAAQALAGDWQPGGLATGIVWGLVWLWHYWMWRHPAKGPTRLVGVAPAIASLVGLTYGVGGLVFSLSGLIDSTVDAFGQLVVSGSTWEPIVQPLVWAVGGGILWWWHWFRVGVCKQTTGFANVLLVFITGFAAFAVFAFGVTLTLATILELVTGSTDPLAVLLDPLGIAIACAAFGALTLVYHVRVVAAHPPVIASATRLVTSGVALAFAATGVGVTVNALLATFASTLVADNIRNLLLGGISALLVGGALWWVTWRPVSASSPGRVATPGRRVYLVVIFGLSALVALITLLVIGFQLFSFLLDSANGGSFIDRSRQAIGLLAATVLVAAYHFAIWRSDRSNSIGHEQVRRIDRVTLVTASGGTDAADAIRAATGARVTVLRRADAVHGEADGAALAKALDGVEAGHVLVVAGAKSAVEVIRLGD
ncbi:hypothetical protein E3N84_04790 [Terrimesophilobacter mesophilus]|uniref:DUF5671 domain-containing protein n=1 Tax=Terrimesophilobacter mesophilus TaxID=433647 RepID=A0A4R8VEZ0_9MICO|nr:DUF5671 domain-containing protein [Terrimesophilobacter mesophilus]TFB80760.1 hypothetical protein E3N84_04790 [Terrimesophilobacter mesophilus]